MQVRVRPTRVAMHALRALGIRCADPAHAHRRICNDSRHNRRGGHPRLGLLAQRFRVEALDRQRRRPKPRPVAEVQEHHDDTPEQQLAEAQRRQRLLDAIETLPEHERFVVALHYLAGQPVKAIAEFLSLSLSAVKKRLFSARNRLAQEDTMQAAHSTPIQLEDRVALFLAIRAGDHATVRRILASQPHLLEAEERWSDEEALAGGFTLAHHLTPLILAAGYGDADMVDLLLELGASPEGRCGCPNGETAVWAAARAGFDTIARRLLEAGASPTANDKGYDVDKLATWRNTPQPSAASIHGDRVTTGIKALDLWVPLERHDVVRVHGAAETGLTVLLSEIAGMIGRAGGRTVWTSWEPRPWHRRELEVLARRSAVDRHVDIVTPNEDEDRQAVLSRGLARARALSAEHPLTAHVIFEQEGRRSVVEARFGELSDAATLTFVVCPWAAVTRGDEAPSTEEPHDALIVTDARLAKQWLYPAIDPQRSHTKRDAPDATKQARALLAEYAAIDPTLTTSTGTPDHQPVDLFEHTITDASAT